MADVKLKTNIDDLFADAKDRNTYLKVAAPMVRYSKLQFRHLIRRYGVDLCFSPMILADSFCQSAKARLNEFTTNRTDTPLIVQFAAKTAYDFVGASELVYPYSDGVDLNCGCPQRWAMKDGYGCSLLSEPDTIHGLVRNFKNCLPSDFSVSVKIRLLNDFKDTVELCRRMEKCGVNFITVHGRKVWHKSSVPPDREALKNLRDMLRIPFVANGNVKSLSEADELYDEVKCDGVMAAQGLLTNPAMFTNDPTTPLRCIQDWVDICNSERNLMTFQCFHHHLVFMLEKTLNKKQKQIFNNLTQHDSVNEFLSDVLDVKPVNLLNEYDYNNIPCVYDCLEYSTLKEKFNCLDSESDMNRYDPNMSHGKYFLDVVNKNDCDLDNMDATIFNEN